jgi:voltage-gated potassium channel
MKKKIADLSGHTILCGFGQMGKQISEELAKMNKDFVIIESDSECEDELRDCGYQFLIGNASDDALLERAGVRKASNIIIVCSTDADNVFISLSAKSLNKDIHALSRVADKSSIPKLRKAGVDKIVSLYDQASKRIVQNIINPAVDDFIDLFSGKSEIDLQVADVEVTKESPCHDREIKDFNLVDKGVMVIGVKNKKGHFQIAPKGSRKLTEGEKLVLMGSDENFSTIIQELVEGR